MGSGFYPRSMEVAAKTLAFLEERHRIISNNIANAGTPFYKARRAPIAEFQKALARAVEDGRRDLNRPLAIACTAHVRDGRAGLQVTPVIEKGANAAPLQHDENNVNLETEMNDLAQNTLLHGVLSNLMRKQSAMLTAAMAEKVGA